MTENHETITRTAPAGDENLTVTLSRDAETSVSTVHVNGAGVVRVVVNGQELPNPTAEQRVDLAYELERATTLADEWSIDDELECLNSALDSALQMLGITRG